MFTAIEIEEAYSTFAAMTLWKTRPSRLACERVAQAANELTTTPEDNPAALFYALGRYPRAFAEAWVDFSRFYVASVALRQGRRLLLSREVARRWLVEIAAQKISFPEIRENLAALSVEAPSSSS